MSDKTKQKKLLRDRGICVIIPTYNNGGTVADVVRRALAECDDVIVVDDGSTDDTASQLSTLNSQLSARPNGTLAQARTLNSPLGPTGRLPKQELSIVTHDRNRGKGRALCTGFKKALELGFSYAITLDADGQHYPEDIPKFLEANRQHPHALIIGSRHIVGNASQRCDHPVVGNASQRCDQPVVYEDSKLCGNQDSGSRFANKFSNFWFYVQTGRRLPDTQTGYRLYPLKKILSSPPLTSRYEAELELLVFASWHGVELVPIDIDVYYPPASERVSHFRPVKDFARISLLNTVLCFLAVVYGLPLRLWRWLMKYVRTIGSLLFFVFFSVFVFTPAVWLYVKIGHTSERKRHNIHRLLQWLSRFVMIRLGIPGAPFSSKVADETAFATPHVIISNHQSHLDLMCLMLFSPRMVFLTNDWVWNNPFYGFMIRQAEYYPVRDGIDVLMPRLQSLVERGYSIAVFPEGTRSPDCRIGRFHQGAFHIAQQLGIGILPACLYGPGKVLPKKSYTLHKSPIFIEVDKPINRDELESMGDTMQQAKTLRHRYLQWYDDLCNRMER